MNNRYTILLSSFLSSFALCFVCVAQEPQDLQIDLRQDEPLRPVEAGVADIDTLGISMRVLEPGLDIPSGFQNVYPVPGMPGYFMRSNGGLYAVFKQSVYTQNGPEIPPGTVFVIGTPYFTAPLANYNHFRGVPGMPAAMMSRLTKRVDTTPQDTRYDPRNDTVPEEDYGIPTKQPNIVSDLTYRRTRLISLMRRAAESSNKGRSGGGAGPG